MTTAPENPASAPTFELIYKLVDTHTSLTGFLDELAALAASCLSSETTVYCGITLERGRRPASVGSSCEQARELDEIQAGFGDGPCLRSGRTGEPQYVADSRLETRWPEYMESVSASGQRSVLAVPFNCEETAHGALNFYSPQPGSFATPVLAQAQDFARLATAGLRTAVRIAAGVELAEDRRRAMETRSAIDMAIGIVMAQGGYDQDEAFAILKQTSSTRNVKLAALAEEIVASVGGKAPSVRFDS